MTSLITTITEKLNQGVRNAAKSRTRFRIFTDSPEIQGFRGIQSRFTKIPRDSVGFTQDSVGFTRDSVGFTRDSVGFNRDSVYIQ